MKKVLVIIIISATLVLLQTSFFPEFFGPTATPNLVLAVCFALLMTGRLGHSLSFALVGGLLIDFMMYKQIGISSFALCILVYSAYYIKLLVFRGMGFYAVYCFLSALVYIQLVQGQLFINLPSVFSALYCTLLAFLFRIAYTRAFTNYKI